MSKFYGLGNAAKVNRGCQLVVCPRRFTCIGVVRRSDTVREWHRFRPPRSMALHEVRTSATAGQGSLLSPDMRLRASHVPLPTNFFFFFLLMKKKKKKTKKRNPCEIHLASTPSCMTRGAVSCPLENVLSRSPSPQNTTHSDVTHN